MDMRITTSDTSVQQQGDRTVRKPDGGPSPWNTGRPFDDEWRRWLTENLLLGATPQGLVEVLTANGFSPHVAAQEIYAAQISPYFRASELLHNRMRKREWILSCYRKLNRLLPSSGEVERRHRLSREDFLREYYSTNRPVIITGMMDDWPAMQKWSLDYFEEKLGDREVEAQMNRESGANYEINSDRYSRRIRFGEYVRMVRQAGQTNDFYLTANNNSRNQEVLAELWDDIIEFPEYLKPNMPGYRFFWFGPPGTITPFHHDLTNNFMAQVIGRKLLKIAPSWDMPLMREPPARVLASGWTRHPRRSGARLPGPADRRMHPGPRRDPVPADRVPALCPGTGHLGHGLVHELRLRQRLCVLLHL